MVHDRLLHLLPRAHHRAGLRVCGARGIRIRAQRGLVDGYGDGIHGLLVDWLGHEDGAPGRLVGLTTGHGLKQGVG